VNFLEANRVLGGFMGGPVLRVRFAASGNVDPLLFYIRAEAAKRGRSAEISTLPFGTLAQTLVATRTDGEAEVMLLLPWDFVPEYDWRTGIPLDVSPPEALLEGARSIARRVAARGSKALYLPAPVPPLYANPAAGVSLMAAISELAAICGARFLSLACFGLGNYLASGVPIAGAGTDEVVEAVLDAALEPHEGVAKVLVTDLDNVLWAGLAGEEGPDGIRCGAAGVGFRHFLYQGLLAKLKASGALLAAVSRNDVALARAPIAAGKTLLGETDFIDILASFEPKSVHIRRLAERLNLGLDAFVFVDDNPIELAEVGSALPMVTCRQFPAHDDALADFLQSLAALFARRTITADDRERTEMYRRRFAAGMPPSVDPGGGEGGADLSEFLKQLKMELTIVDRSSGERERAVQLINKTNQFNLNGRRLTDDDVAQVLRDGGKLYSATLDDRTGRHGEILACLLDRDRVVVALVLSCRVFQRRVEHAFVAWLLGRTGTSLRLAYAETQRNTPLREFLNAQGFSLNGDEVLLDATRFLAEHGVDLELFSVTEVGID
jgi:FkbH-like protein